MARGDSIIRVSIIGDVTKLVKALGQADAATGGLLKSATKAAGGLLLAGKATDFVFDTIQTGLAKADAFHDSLDRISRTVSPEFADRIEDVAFSMTDIGLSADEVGTLAANFAALATSAGATKDTLDLATPNLLRLASAVAATTGKTVDEVVEDIGKAIKGNTRPVEEYGIIVEKALTPDQTITSILAQLKALYPDVTAATDDLAGAQDTLGAKWANFTIMLGEALEGPLKGVVDVFIEMIDEDIPQLVDGIGDFGDAFVSTARFVLGPLGNVRDALQGILDLLGRVGNIGSTGFVGSSEREVTFAERRAAERNGLSSRQGGP